MRKLIALLIVTTTWLAFAQPRCEAMLIPSNAARPADTMNRAADLQTIQTTLESKAIRAKLHAMGLTDSEIQSRLSRLSDAQKHQLASQIRAVNPAGDLLIGLLIVVVLVLLVIFLFKRI